MSASRHTPLYDRHVALNARMVDFSGWAMPVQYDGILAEHHRTRTDVAVFDTCHMGVLRVEGDSALDALSGLVTADLRTLGDNRCRYGFLLNERGGVLDDLIAYRFGVSRWMLVVNAGTQAHDAQWIADRLPPGVRLTHLAERCGKLDVQGPRAAQAVRAALGLDVAALPRFAFLHAEACGGPVIVSRTGYTGEDGFELYAEPERIVSIWDALLGAGVRPAGLGARDTLRLEAGLPLYGHELTEQLTPVEANLMRYAAKAEPFVGRDALAACAQKGIDYRLTGFKLESRQSARHGDRVESGGGSAGWVTSGSFAPTLGVAVGMAYVRPPLAEIGARFQIAAERRRLEARSVVLPFYRRKTERET